MWKFLWAGAGKKHGTGAAGKRQIKRGLAEKVIFAKRKGGQIFEYQECYDGRFMLHGG